MAAEEVLLLRGRNRDKVRSIVHRSEVILALNADRPDLDLLPTIELGYLNQIISRMQAKLAEKRPR